MKHYLNAGVFYAVIGLAAGVFYREYTKYSAFTGSTRLSLMHGHYLILGFLFFLLLLILEKQFAWSGSAGTRFVVIGYHAGLNITGAGFLLRGINDVTAVAMSRGLDASLAGISGLGHILIASTLILILRRIGKKVRTP